MPYTANYNLSQPIIGGDIDRWGQEWNDNATKLETSLTAFDTRIDTLEASMATVLANYVQKSGSTMTGLLTLSAAPIVDLHAATKKYVDDASSALTSSSLQKAGGTMTGAITLSGDPSSNLHAAPKQYVDNYTPAGAIIAFGATSAPSGWLPCDGSAVSRTTYARLFAAIGTTWGSGDGSATFNVPDLRGYFLRGSGTNGDGSSGPSLGVKQSDDFKSHTHTATQASHTHTVSSATSTGGTDLQGGTGYNRNVSATTSSAQPAITVDATGGTETRPKNIGVNYIIKV